MKSSKRPAPIVRIRAIFSNRGDVFAQALDLPSNTTTLQTSGFPLLFGGRFEFDWKFYDMF
jgi:hypothetical protein